MTLTLIAIIFCSAFLSLDAVSAEFQQATAPVSDRFGVVSSHFVLNDPAAMDRELSAMADAGIKWIRFGMPWPDLEPSRGAWNFAKTDLAVNKAAARGIKVLGLLGGSPPWANGGLPYVYPPTDLASWRHYLWTLATRYRGKVSAWEIWNEENITWFWMWPDANAYVSLVKETTPVIRSVDPSATIVMGGVAGLDPNFLDACFKAGVADYVDAIAYHPYPETFQFLNYEPQESNCRYIVDWLHSLMAAYTSKPLQLWITEFGWTTCSGTPPGVSEATQASYLLRTLVNYAGLPVDKVFYYNLYDESYDPAAQEANYGLLANDFRKKPAYSCFATFERVLGDAVPAGAGSASFTCTNPGTLESHCFELADGSLVIALWKSDAVVDSVTVKVADKEFGSPQMVDPISGETLSGLSFTRDADGTLSLNSIPVGGMPALLKVMPPSRFAVTDVSPDQSNQLTLMVGTQVTGSGFMPGARVRLEIGDRVLRPYNATVVTGERIDCNFGFFLVGTGDYDLVVRNPDGSEARLNSAFKIKPLWW